MISPMFTTVRCRSAGGWCRHEGGPYQVCDGTRKLRPLTAKNTARGTRNQVTEPHYPTTEKHCVRCGQLLPAAEFRPNRANTWTGLDSWCRGCRNERTRQWRAENPDYIAAYNE